MRGLGTVPDYNPGVAEASFHTLKPARWVVTLESEKGSNPYRLHRLVDTARPPPEVASILTAVPCPSEAILGWVAVPSYGNSQKRVGALSLRPDAAVDILDRIQDLLGDPRLHGTLRTIDVFDGCGNHCSTCLADSANLSKMVTLDSLARAFSNPCFLAMLQPDSLRIGSSGDLIDHPQAVEILKIVLEATRGLDQAQSGSESRHHQIKIYTGFRPNKAAQLDCILELACQNPDRMRVKVSLPLNKKDTINTRFLEYARQRPHFFGREEPNPYSADYPRFPGIERRGEDVINVIDVRHPMVLLMMGRVMDEQWLAEKVPPKNRVLAGVRELDFQYRGLAKTYLNADGLWLMMYATTYESHTSRVFTPLTASNLEYLARVPYHPDFPTPPNWPGGRGQVKKNMRPEELRHLLRETEASGLCRLPLTVAK